MHGGSREGARRSARARAPRMRDVRGDAFAWRWDPPGGALARAAPGQLHLARAASCSLDALPSCASGRLLAPCHERAFGGYLGIRVGEASHPGPRALDGWLAAPGR
eukprot:11728596-Alexandrium_andersonii.AAC.1